MPSPLILAKPPSAPLNSTWKVFTHLEGEEPVRPVRLRPPPSNLPGLHGAVRPHQQDLTSGDPDETQPADLMADRDGRRVTKPRLLSGGGSPAASLPVLPAGPHLTRCGFGPSAHVDEEDGGQ